MINLTDASDDKHYLADEIMNVNIKRKRTKREGQPEGDRELQAKVGGIEKVLLLKVKILQLLHSIRSEDVNSCSSDIVIENEGPLKRKIPQIFKSVVYKEFKQEKVLHREKNGKETWTSRCKHRT